MKKRHIILDGMGGDYAPGAVIDGAMEVTNKFRHKIIIVGNETMIKEYMASKGYKSGGIEIIHAEEVITNNEAPVKAVRTKLRSSVVVGLNLLKDSGNDVFISAGNTGALMAGGLFILGRVRGIDRPAIASTYPIMRGDGVSLLVDSGANAECKPNNLLEFATMGSIYMNKVLGIDKPKVGLVNMGAEENKGTTVLKAAYELLSKSMTEHNAINFIGNIEARDVAFGIADVLVCDGYVGNVILKLTEGLAWNIFEMIKGKFTEGIPAKLGAILLANKLKELKNALDYSEYGGAPILGVRGALVKIHGSSNANAVKNAILKAAIYAENEVVQCIENAVIELLDVGIS